MFGSFVQRKIRMYSWIHPGLGSLYNFFLGGNPMIEALSDTRVQETLDVNAE